MKKIGIALACLLMAVGCCACGATEEQPLDVNVYMPDGAPALALAGMMATDTQDDGVNYRVVDAKLIASKVTNQDGAKNADLCVMPITAASKLLGGGAKYTMLGAVTHGNLYLLAKEGAYTQENLASLVGKKVGVLQINEVPGLTFKAVLSKHGIAWQELTNDGTMDETKVNLVALADASAVATVEADCYMIAEPAASAQVQKNGFVLAGSVQELYGGEEGYPQAVLVVKNELLETRADWVEQFVAQVAEAPQWLKTATGEEIVAAVGAHMDDPDAATSLKAPLLSSGVLERCGIFFTYAAATKVQAMAFLGEMISVKADAAAIPADSFFWQYQQ